MYFTVNFALPKFKSAKISKCNITTLIWAGSLPPFCIMYQLTSTLYTLFNIQNVHLNCLKQNIFISKIPFYIIFILHTVLIESKELLGVIHQRTFLWEYLTVVNVKSSFIWESGNLWQFMVIHWSYISLIVNLHFKGSVTLLFLSSRQDYHHQSHNRTMAELAWLPSHKHPY